MQNFGPCVRRKFTAIDPRRVSIMFLFFVHDLPGCEHVYDAVITKLKMCVVLVDPVATSLSGPHFRQGPSEKPAARLHRLALPLRKIQLNICSGLEEGSYSVPGVFILLPAGFLDATKSTCPCPLLLRLN